MIYLVHHSLFNANWRGGPLFRGKAGRM